MTVPQIPTGFPETPVSSSELQTAREGVARRGNRITAMLGILAGLTALVSALGLWAMWQGLETLPRFLRRLSELDTSSEPFPDLSAAIPVWMAPSIVLLCLVGAALYVWAMLVARRTIGAIRDQTLNPTPDNADALEASARTVRPWLTLGQFAPMLNVVISLMFIPIFMALAKNIDPQGEMGLAFGPLQGGMIFISSVVQSLPTILINWLILGAIKRWLDAVVTRSRNRTFPVRPFARQVDPWLLFTLILLILGTLSLILSGLPLLALPALIPASELSDPDLIKLGITPDLIRNTALGLAGLILFGGLIYLLQTFLIAWSRGFAMNVATVLDSTLPAPAANAAHNVDLWSGPEQVQARREPK